MKLKAKKLKMNEEEIFLFYFSGSLLKCLSRTMIVWKIHTIVFFVVCFIAHFACTGLGYIISALCVS